MKFILLSFFLLLTEDRLFAQIEQNDFEPIEATIRRLQPTGTVYYADNADKNVYSRLAVLLNKSVFKSQWDTTKENTLRLTAEERKFIRSQLDFSVKRKLPDSLFGNSKRIRKVSLVPLVDSINRKILDSIGQLPDSLKGLAYRKFRSHSFPYWSFIFTKPIYIRERTLTVYYFMYYSLSGGEDGVWFYKKNEDKWTRWIMVPGMGGAW